MCVLLVAYRSHPKFRLIVASNRDEFYSRPSTPATFWWTTQSQPQREILSGRDLRQGGTWLGVSCAGRFAAISNYRDPNAVRPDARSRGALVKDFLTGSQSVTDYLSAIANEASAYNDFNLLAGVFPLIGTSRAMLPQSEKLAIFSSRSDRPPQALSPGIYGLSNHLLDTPWPKVRYGKEKFDEILRDPGKDHHEVLDSLSHLLEDRSHFPDSELPETGVGHQMEQVLSPIFIHAEKYGTVASSVLAISDSEVFFRERCYGSEGLKTDAEFHFALEPSGPKVLARHEPENEDSELL